MLAGAVITGAASFPLWGVCARGVPCSVMGDVAAPGLPFGMMLAGVSPRLGVAAVLVADWVLYSVLVLIGLQVYRAFHGR